MVVEKVEKRSEGSSCHQMVAYITSHIPAKSSRGLALSSVIPWAYQLSRHKDYAFFSGGHEQYGDANLYNIQ